MIYYLTYSKLPNLPQNEIKIVDFLRKRGKQVMIIDWQKLNCDVLQPKDVVLLRSTWDYDLFPEKFKSFLNQLLALEVKVLNHPELMLWNMDKRYMFEFQELGLSVIPTYRETEKKLILKNHSDSEKFIAKSFFSAGARGLKSYTKQEFTEAHLQENYIYQPFVPSVPEQGEWSLLYVNGHFSHAILKKAKLGDFRVQTDYGGTFDLVDVDNSWIQLGKSFLNYFPSLPFFARVDIVLWENNPVLIELEVIEPELFLMNDTILDFWANEIEKQISS